MSYQSGYQSIGGPGTPPVAYGSSEKYVSFAVPGDQVVYLDTPQKSSGKTRHGGTQTSATPSSAAVSGKKIGLAPLVVLIFYSVSGGPFGIEDIVRAGGPCFALMGFSLLLVWALPEALITAELSTALPGASGSVGWVRSARLGAHVLPSVHAPQLTCSPPLGGRSIRTILGLSKGVVGVAEWCERQCAVPHTISRLPH